MDNMPTCLRLDRYRLQSRNLAGIAFLILAAFSFITPASKKVRRLRYRFEGREKTLVIGEYPSISLAEARAKASKAKLMISTGDDPAAEKKKSKNIDTYSDQIGVIFR
ncbi:hypothetical protein AU510_08000 [Lonsdalea britannica]|uniref:Arm DNA-binding domain-containing protein n=1 Tax=Lonsdalea britannica TaxID=1082704 RepID=UPI000A1F8E23|nr:Arm DNA-binding domain-containing protein [Lonsdalea britannica]OSN06284.1 hypothetical protein AU510_08000 [Lonsdalea britannica]